MPPATDGKEILAGLVDRVTFHSRETRFCVLQLKARGQLDPVAVVGSAASVQPGEYTHASGRWDNHRNHGLQFRAAFLKVTPTTRDGSSRADKCRYV
jgi:exodeoxyribonuclease V alpha subunit